MAAPADVRLPVQPARWRVLGASLLLGAIVCISTAALTVQSAGTQLSHGEVPDLKGIALLILSLTGAILGVPYGRRIWRQEREGSSPLVVTTAGGDAGDFRELRSLIRDVADSVTSEREARIQMAASFDGLAAALREATVAMGKSATLMQTVIQRQDEHSARVVPSLGTIASLPALIDEVRTDVAEVRQMFKHRRDDTEAAA